MKSYLKAAVLTIAVAALTCTAARAEDTCKKDLRIGRVISNGSPNNGNYSYEVEINSNSNKPVAFTLEAGEFPKPVRVRPAAKFTLAPHGNMHLPIANNGTFSLDHTKVGFYYDVRMSLPQPWILVSDCVAK